eukprot:CAMPEP_0202485730 /NCGR_PEP_ID=MMETSP1361-20130828/4495_1 /ASSEMBLY_ACC=CAM_ASM_000849 /TAXON_ID=210615 /ORGANISM="Staurosira complex sp., Strain CCMP2646" /LENGTH=367 /DNA_ID=CAMNT_0049114701 /DNA_START=148 /DNA_END=1254 /DNA_ORIENTATION=+
MAGNATSTKDKPEYNPRWKGYVYILVCSLVALSSICNVPKEVKPSHWATTVGISSTTFSISFLILLLDRCQCFKFFNYTKAADGKVEGWVLLFFLLIWIVGVAILTKPSGLAYFATNIYFSSWLTLISCVYTLNQWSSSKDIISIQELTQLSATLKSWYCLLLTSLVCLGSSISMNIYFASRSLHTGETAFAIALGLFSVIVSLFFILVHYKFFSDCCGRVKQGGWLELSTAFFMILCWTVGVAVLTQENGVAATMAGSGCHPDFDIYSVDNCTVVVQTQVNGTNVTYNESCDVLYAQDIPGSNLYFFSWFCLMASANITLRWKAAQALQFAQAAQVRATTGGAKDASPSDRDSEYEDAVEDDEDAI